MILLKLFITFLKIGAFTFGGGYAMIPLINAEAVGNGWITERELIDLVAVSEATPGPFAVNAATFVGIKCAGIPGGVCATLGVILPSFIVILIVSRFYEAFKESKGVQGVMSGLRPCVVGLLAYSVYSVGTSFFLSAGTLTGPGLNLSFVVISVLFVCSLILALKRVNPIIIIASCAIIGVLAGYIFNL